MEGWSISIFDIDYWKILMDIGMEPMDGLECTRRLREWERTRTDAFTPLVIIAQTANAHAESKDICMEAGMSDYLHKPISLDELVRVLRKTRMDLDRMAAQQQGLKEDA